MSSAIVLPRRAFSFSSMSCEGRRSQLSPLPDLPIHSTHHLDLASLNSPLRSSRSCESVSFPPSLRTRALKRTHPFQSSNLILRLAQTLGSLPHLLLLPIFVLAIDASLEMADASAIDARFFLKAGELGDELRLFGSGLLELSRLLFDSLLRLDGLLECGDLLFERISVGGRLPPVRMAR